MLKLLALSLCCTVPASAGKLDLAPTENRAHPAIAAAYSAVVPGAGWYHTSEQGGGVRDFWVGTGYLVTIVGGAAGAATLITNKNSGINPFLGMVLAVGVVSLRFGDVRGAARRADELREKNGA